jgi:hypothetical protein
MGGGARCDGGAWSCSASGERASAVRMNSIEPAPRSSSGGGPSWRPQPMQKRIPPWFAVPQLGQATVAHAVAAVWPSAGGAAAGGGASRRTKDTSGAGGRALLGGPAGFCAGTTGEDAVAASGEVGGGAAPIAEAVVCAAAASRWPHS